MQVPELVQLASRLPNTVLASRACSTTKKYQGAFDRWKRWATERELVAFPVETARFVLYLQYIGDNTGSKAAVEEAVNAVSWVQRLAGQEQVSQSPLVKSIVEGFQRLLAKPKKRKEPVTPMMLQEIVASLSTTPTLAERRLAAICLLAFSAFLRFDEVEKLRGCDVKFFEDRMEITIASNKTDQYRQGSTVPIARTGLPTCPVAMLEQYFSLGKISTDSEERVFRGICSTKNGDTLRPSGALSYTRMREIVLEKIQSLGYDARCYGLHSFRAGGATAAANASGLSDRHFKRHGHWRSETAKDKRL